MAVLSRSTGVSPASPRPRVSVLMSVFNGMPFLEEAVESVLSQRFVDFELLIMNDGSTDGSEDFLARLVGSDKRLKVFHRANAGLTTALNELAAHARGQFFARMDSDDRCRAHRFLRQVQFLHAHPQVVAAGSWTQAMDSDGDAVCTSRRPTSHLEIERGLLREVDNGGHITHPTAMMRADAFRAVGGYREQFALSQDRDLWLRLAMIGELANLPEILLDYRISTNSVSATRSEVQRQCSEEVVRQARLARNLTAEPPVKFQTRRSAVETEQRLTLAKMACNSGHFRTARKHLIQLAFTGVNTEEVRRLRQRSSRIYRVVQYIRFLVPRKWIARVFRSGHGTTT